MKKEFEAQDKRDQVLPYSTFQLSTHGIKPATPVPWSSAFVLFHRGIQKQSNFSSAQARVRTKTKPACLEAKS